MQQGINLYLTQGNSTDLKVEADDNIIDILITEVKNAELKIYFDKNVYKAKARNVASHVLIFKTLKPRNRVFLSIFLLH